MRTETPAAKPSPAHFTFKTALLIEDEPALGTALELALARMKIPAQRATRLSTARAALKDQAFDFILLDRGLPDGDGIELCRELRAQGYLGAILVLTASGDTHDRVDGLQAGADDYLPKPFSWEELDARIRALSRRLGSRTPSPQLWSLSPDTLTVVGKKGPVTLTPLEFKLVAQMIDSAPRILSRDQLLAEVWGYVGGTQSRTVDYFMTRVRKHLELTPDHPEHFLSVRGIGYRFDPG
jgi:two-component system catabolic regulation response regulator CreB